VSVLDALLLIASVMLVSTLAVLGLAQLAARAFGRRWK